MLLRLACLGVTKTLALLRLLPMSDRAKDTEIVALRHHITILERHLHGERIRFTPPDRPGSPPCYTNSPARRTSDTWTTFLRSQAQAIIAADSWAE